MKRNYENHGSTISGAIILGLLALCAVNLARAASPTSAATWRAPTFDPTETQFTVQQNLIVETVTCQSYAVHYDLHEYGTVQGAGCSTTGPLSAANGTYGGHISITFEMLDGSRVILKACRVDSHVALATPSGEPFESYALDCI